MEKNINQLALIVWRLSQKAILAEVPNELSQEMYHAAMDDIELLVPHESLLKEHYPYLAKMVEANMRNLDRAKENFVKECEHDPKDMDNT